MEQITEKKEMEEDAAETIQKANRRLMELTDVLGEIDMDLEAVSRMCAVLKLGFESPDFCDSKDAAGCMWVMQQFLDWIQEQKISPWKTRKD